MERTTEALTHLFIINPAAGSHDQTAEYRQKIDAVCKKHGLTYRIAISQAAGDCGTIARQAAESGCPYRIYACGGDGTLNEIVSRTAGFPNVSVSVLAGGSGNDFIRIFSDRSAFYDLERLIDCEERQFDLIRCNDDCALSICSVGLDARIGTKIQAFKRFPLLHGGRAYVVSTVLNVIRGVADHYTIEINGETIDGEMCMICVCNGRYYGGGFNPVPEADPTDGILDVLLVKKVSRLLIAQVAGKYKAGRYAEFPKQIRHFRTNHLHIRCDRPSSVNLDGELRKSQDIDIRLSEHKVRFFYPKGLTF